MCNPTDRDYYDVWEQETCECCGEKNKYCLCDLDPI